MKKGAAGYKLVLRVAPNGTKQFEGAQRAVFAAMKDSAFTRLDECVRRGDKVLDGQVGAFFNLPLVLTGSVVADADGKPAGEDDGDEEPAEPFGSTERPAMEVVR